MYNKTLGSRLCEVEGCSDKYLAKGVCRKHYERLRRYSTLENLALNTRSITETLEDKTEWRGECLVWTGYLNDAGYGILYRDGKSLRAHRMAWLDAGLPLEDGQLLDHFTCFNRACVNVAHLRPATSKQNNENRKGANKNSTTGVRGVTPDKRHGGFKIQVTHNRVNHSKRGFKTVEEATVAVEAMRLELFGAVL
jgi:hypothetical protein